MLSAVTEVLSYEVSARVPEGPRKWSPGYLRVASSVSCPQNLLWPSFFSSLCLQSALLLASLP